MPPPSTHAHRLSPAVNTLHYGDNLDVLRRDIPAASVDLIYLDPPFNSNQGYNVILRTHEGAPAAAQLEAFDDTWGWGPEAQAQYKELTEGATLPKVAELARAIFKILGTSDLFAYLVMMLPRLVEMHRVLKPTGSLYLHCDPAASHHLKLALDAIFGAENFQNEIVWKRTTAHNDPKRFGRISDRILFYAKTRQKTFNRVTGGIAGYSREQLARFRFTDPGGRRYKCENLTAPHYSATRTVEWRGTHPGLNRQWRFGTLQLEQLWAAGKIATKAGGTPKKDGLKEFLDEMQGPALQDVWTDIDFPPTTDERLGYQTQKPVALLERIVASSSNPGDVVLDPFSGCGTTIEAAQRLKRSWVGIDVTYIAIDLIRKRLAAVFGAELGRTDVRGIPRDLQGAQGLFDRNPFDFERWAVSLVDGQPNAKQVGDRGIDGIIQFPFGPEETGKGLVSVKGGESINPSFVRDLLGTVDTQSAHMGVLILMKSPTPGMRKVAADAGPFVVPALRRTFPKIQILTVAELLEGKRPGMPTPFGPYIKAKYKALTQLPLQFAAEESPTYGTDED